MPRKIHPNEKDDANYPLAIAASNILLGKLLQESESKDERKAKQVKILTEKVNIFNQTAEAYCKKQPPSSIPITYKSLKWIKDWKLSDRLSLLIDVWFIDPYLPYEIKYSEKNFKAAWEKLGASIGVKSTLLETIEKTVKDAKKAHRNINWLKIGLIGVGTASLLLAGGWMVAPTLGGLLGGAAGLYGAAAISHGLALLGGGALAAGGAGMAGGMWLVATAAAVTGGTLSSITQLAYQLGAKQFQAEVIKLQVNLEVLRTENLLSSDAVKEKLSILQEQKQNLEKSLRKERMLNEPKAQRIKDIEEKVKAIANSIEWFRKNLGTSK